MHSPYETAGSKDMAYLEKAFEEFFKSAIRAEATVHSYLSNSDSKIRRNIRVSGGSFILPAQMNVQNVSFCLLPPGKTVFPYISG